MTDIRLMDSFPRQPG